MRTIGRRVFDSPQLCIEYIGIYYRNPSWRLCCRRILDFAPLDRRRNVLGSKPPPLCQSPHPLGQSPRPHGGIGGLLWSHRQWVPLLAGLMRPYPGFEGCDPVTVALSGDL